MTIYISLLLILLTSCNSAASDNENASVMFTNVDSALNNCKQSKEYKSLLFALVTKDVDSKQKLGWEILGDKDVIATAKKDYILIIIEPTKISLPKDSDTKEFVVGNLQCSDFGN
jgi:hypothetical protein